MVYISDKYKDTDGCRASRRMLEAAGIKLTQFESSRKIEIDFDIERV